MAIDINAREGNRLRPGHKKAHPVSGGILKRIATGIGIMVASLLLVVLLMGFSYQAGLAASGDGRSGILQQMRGMQARQWLPKRVLDHLKQDYFMEIDAEAEKQLTYGAVQGMLHKLVDEPYHDAFTYFYDPELFVELQAQTTGEYAGIGILMSLTVDGMYPEVVTVFDDTPAEEQGLMEGDVITQIDGEDAFGMILPEVASRIKGEPGTSVGLELFRPSDGEFMEVTLERREVEYDSVSDYEMLAGNVGYIRISTFGGDTDEEFGEALERFEAEGAEALIIDLRNNSGGILDSAIKIADFFIEEGMIVEVNQRIRPNQIANADPKSKKYNWPLVLMLNENSASCSEVLAGALIDHGLGVIVGERSFGKGVVQEVSPVDWDEESGEPVAALAVTIGEYYTLNHRDGNNIHGNGIEPTVWYDLLNQLEEDPELARIEDRIGELADELRLLRAEFSQRMKENNAAQLKAAELARRLLNGEEIAQVGPLEMEDSEHQPLVAGTDFGVEPDGEGEVEPELPDGEGNQ